MGCCFNHPLLLPPPRLRWMLISLDDVTSDIHQRGAGAGSAAAPMVAVLTTRRVLMLSATRLTPVALAWGHPPDSAAVLDASGGLSVSAVSIAWAGSSVVCALEDGRYGKVTGEG